MDWLVAARVMQAVGAALLTPASLSIVLDAFPHSKRAMTVSLWGAVGGLAAAVGPSLGSFVVQAVGWQWAFYLNLPLGALSLWRGAALLKEAKKADRPRPVDGVGMGLLILGVGALALSIVQSQSPHWTATDLSVAAATGVVALIGFVIWARVAPAPLVDLRLFRHRTYTFVNLATLVFGIAFSMMFFAFFFFMTNVWHYSLAQAGLAITPGPLLVIPCAILSGRLAARIGHRPFLVGGGLLYACSGLWFLLVPGAQPAYLTHWLPGLILSGIERRIGAALAVGCSREPAAGRPIRRGQRREPGDATDRLGDRRRDHGAVARPCGVDPQKLRAAVRRPCVAGVADDAAVPAGEYQAADDRQSLSDWSHPATGGIPAPWVVQNKTGARLGIEITGELAAVIARINVAPAAGDQRLPHPGRKRPALDTVRTALTL